MRSVFSKIKNWWVIIVIVVSIIISLPLFRKNFNIMQDDGVQHICRIIGTGQSIIENERFPVVISKLCNDFGYSWNIFYSPLTAYLPLLFSFFTNSYVLILKFFLVFISIFTGLFMYKFVNYTTKNSKIAALAAILYVVSPYRLTDMYIRMAVAELMSFMFIPLVFLGIYKILNKQCSKDDKYWDLDLVIGATGLILSHLIITLYVIIISILYVVFEYKKINIKVLKKFIITGIIVVLLTAFFWVPLLEHKYGADYEVFKQGRMERTNVLVINKLKFSQLFITLKHDQMVFQMGAIILIGLILTPLAVKKIPEKHKKIYYFSIAMGIVSLIMTLTIFPFEKLPRVLKLIQFSFRMLEFSSFFLSFVVAMNYSFIIKNFKGKDVVCLCLIGILFLIPLKSHISTGNINKLDESELIKTVPVTSNTGRVHPGCAIFEYLPTKAFTNRKYIETRENKIYVIEGLCSIKNEQKNGTNYSFEIENVEENTVLELPYIYYLGYCAKSEINGENIQLKTEESENGFVQVKVPNVENAKIQVSFDGTLLMQVSYIISGCTLLLLFIFKFYSVYKLNQTSKLGKITSRKEK